MAWLLYTPGSAQDKLALDTLTLQSRTSNITVKVKALNELCRIFTGIDNQKAMQLAQEALSISKKKGDRALIAQSYNRLGTIYDYRGVLDSANQQYLKALAIFEQINDKSGIASVYQNIGVMYYFQNDLDQAIDWYKKAIVLREETKELDYVAKLQNNIAVVLRRQEKYDASIDYYKKALTIKLRFKDRESVASTYANLASVFLYKTDFDSAKVYLQRSIDINTAINSSVNLAGNYFSYAQIFFGEKKYPAAREQLKKSIDYSTKAESNDILYNDYDLLWQIDTATGNYKSAVINQHIAATYKAKVFKSDRAGAVEQMNVLYETEKKDREIAELNMEQETKNAQNRLLLISLLLAGAVLLITAFYFLQLKRKNTLLARQKKEVEEKTQLLNEQAGEIAKFRTQMNPHFMFNALVSVQRSILTEDRHKAAESLTQLSKLMRITLENSEKEMITLKDEKAFIEKYIEFEQARFDHSFTVSLDIAPDIDTENTLLPVMIIQPFVENAIKHGIGSKGKEGNISIVIRQMSTQAAGGHDTLVININDNGIGINSAAEQRPVQAVSHTSKGMEITRQRILSTWKDYGPFKEEYIYIRDKKEMHNVPPGETGTYVILILPFIENF